MTTAFGSGGATFAICASIIVLMALGLQIWGLGSVDVTSKEFKSVLVYGTPNLAAMSLLIIGGFLNVGPRKFFWVLFVVVILGAMVLARYGDWLVRPGHFAERHGLIVIIALGEIIVAIGISVVNSLAESDGLPSQTLVALCAAGVLAGLLWWGYFDRVNPALEHRAEAKSGRDRAHFIADVYTGLHVVIVGGIILMAAAGEEILLHPKDEVHTEFLIMFVGGIALYFGGIALSVVRAFQVLAFERLTAVVAIAALAFFGRSLTGVTLLILVDLILLATVVFEYRRIESPTPAVGELAEQLLE